MSIRHCNIIKVALYVILSCSRGWKQSQSNGTIVFCLRESKICVWWVVCVYLWMRVLWMRVLTVLDCNFLSDERSGCISCFRGFLCQCTVFLAPLSGLFLACVHTNTHTSCAYLSIDRSNLINTQNFSGRCDHIWNGLQRSIRWRNCCKWHGEPYPVASLKSTSQHRSTVFRAHEIIKCCSSMQSRTLLTRVAQALRMHIQCRSDQTSIQLATAFLSTKKSACGTLMHIIRAEKQRALTNNKSLFLREVVKSLISKSVW